MNGGLTYDRLFLRTNALSSTYGLVVGLYLAFFGNTIYYKSSLKKIEKHQSQNMGRDLKRLDGTSWFGVGLTVLFILAYMFWIGFMTLLFNRF